MEPIPLVRANVILPLVNFLKEIGAPVQRLITESKLSMVVCENPEALIPLFLACLLFEKAARSQGIAHLGLLIGRRTRLENLGTFGCLICQSLTLHEAITRACRLIAAHNTGERLWFKINGGQAQLCHKLLPGINHGRQQADHYALIYLQQLVRLAAGENWRPREIHFETAASPGLTRLEPLADARVAFHQEATALFFSPDLLSLPLKKPIKSSVLPSEAETALRASAPASDFPGSVRQTLGTLLQEEYPDIVLVAEVAGMSTRTFQRRLRATNLSYSRLIEQVRFDKAMRLLTESHISLTDIAFELGYTEPANFTRAFRRWAGVSPRRFRHLHANRLICQLARESIPIE
jgi:AraC-like DNA-binding protein